MKGFRDYILNEGINYDEKIEAVIGRNKGLDSAMWGWFEDNLGDDYDGDSVPPEEYLESMSNKELKTLYTFLRKKFKGVFED